MVHDKHSLNICGSAEEIKHIRLSKQLTKAIEAFNG
jgi:hypothetical protein